MALYTSVDLSGNALTYLPSKVQCLVCVTQLNLDDNLLDQLPQEVGKLKTLKTLSLKNNSILLIIKNLEGTDSSLSGGNIYTVTTKRGQPAKRWVLRVSIIRRCLYTKSYP